MKKREYWSDEDIKRLRELYPNNSSFEVSKMLKRTLCSINAMAHICGLKKSKNYYNKGNGGRIKKGQRISIKTEFKKGHKPVNAGKNWGQIMSIEAQEKARKTTFQKGHLPHNTKQNGIITIRTDNRNVKYEWIRIDIAKWIPLYHHVWIQANGSIPKGHVLAFKDKNTMNAKLENIILLTKAENCKRNSIVRIPLEVRQTMIALKKLKKEIEKSNKKIKL